MSTCAPASPTDFPAATARRIVKSLDEAAVIDEEAIARTGTKASKIRVPLLDGLLDALAAVDQEMASVLLELYVLNRARLDATEGRPWSAHQLSKQLKAVQKKLKKRRAARRGDGCDGGCNG